jgi:hypothetical protein
MKKNKTHTSDKMTRAFKSKADIGDFKREPQTTIQWPNKPQKLQSESAKPQQTSKKAEHKQEKLQLRHSLRNAGNGQLQFWADQKNPSGKPEVSPTKKWIELLIVGGIIIALAFILLTKYIDFSKDSAINQGTNKVIASWRKNVAEVKINWPIPPAFSSDIHDPMQFAAVALIPRPQIEIVQNKYQVTGIMGSEERRLAVVGTEIVAEGDTVQGAMVIKINQDGVEFEKDNERWVEPVIR